MGLFTQNLKLGDNKIKHKLYIGVMCIVSWTNQK